MTMINLGQSKLKLDEINKKSAEAAKPTPEPVRYRRGKGPKFEERHVRVTTYFENDLHEKVEWLREIGRVASVTDLIPLFWSPSPLFT